MVAAAARRAAPLLVAALALDACAGLRQARRGAPILDASSRRQLVQFLPVALLPLLAPENAAADSKMEYMPALEGKDYGKPRTVYPDFKVVDNDLQVKDVKVGEGAAPRAGDRVVIDWSGYTIGYYGRPFEAAGKTKGGAFEAEKDLFRFELGDKKVIPALERAVSDMRVGGVRQIIVPPELGYPPSDPGHDKIGPKPSTFSGQRALNFVLQNQGLIDKTLLINVELKRVDKPGERGFKS